MRSRRRRKKLTKLLFPAPLAPIRTLTAPSSNSSSFLMDLKPSIVSFLMVSAIAQHQHIGNFSGRTGGSRRIRHAVPRSGAESNRQCAFRCFSVPITKPQPGPGGTTTVTRATRLRFRAVPMPARDRHVRLRSRVESLLSRARLALRAIDRLPESLEAQERKRCSRRLHLRSR